MKAIGTKKVKRVDCHALGRTLVVAYYHSHAHDVPNRDGVARDAQRATSRAPARDERFLADSPIARKHEVKPLLERKERNPILRVCDWMPSI